MLQVDRQAKGSYKTSEAAQSAALEIKRVIRWFKCRFMIASITRSGWLSYRAPPRELSDARATAGQDVNGELVGQRHVRREDLRQSPKASLGSNGQRQSTWRSGLHVGCSVPALRVGTLALAVGAACGLSLHAAIRGVTKRRFSRSIRKPGRASRRLHAGCHSGCIRHPPS